eukprot:scaffold33818_cov39-Attheya_sp.AAC.1
MEGMGHEGLGLISGGAFFVSVRPGAVGDAGAMAGFVVLAGRKVIEGGWVMSMCFDWDVQSAEGGGLGNGGGCGLGVEFGGHAGVVSSAGTMAGFAVLGRFHRRKVGRN